MLPRNKYPADETAPAAITPLINSRLVIPPGFSFESHWSDIYISTSVGMRGMPRCIRDTYRTLSAACQFIISAVAGAMLPQTRPEKQRYNIAPRPMPQRESEKAFLPTRRLLF